MKKSIKLIIVFLLMMSIPINATSGRLKNASIQTCGGETYGSHGDGHWHVASQNSNGTYNATGSPIYGNPCIGEPEEDVKENNNSQTRMYEDPAEEAISKSSDTSLSKVTVNDKEVSLSDSMTFDTEEKEAIIKVKLGDDKAKAEYEEKNSLSLGANEISIVVTAEDETSKTYLLTVNRSERKLSDDTGISVSINGVVINFTDGKYTYNIDSDNIEITYTLNHEKAITTLDTSEKINPNENTNFQFIVIAEDGSRELYQLNLIAMPKTEPMAASEIIANFIIYGGISLIISSIIKKARSKNMKKDIKI